MESIYLKVFDVVPPNPPKLVELVEKALSIGRIGKPIKVVTDILDLNTLTQASKTPFTMFLCYTSELRSGENALFLDQAPDISSVDGDNITLIGCNLSLNIFSSLYGSEPAFINMCPKMRIAMEQTVYKCITRCCLVDEKHERIGDIAYVPWGAKISDVEEAILHLFDLY